MIIPKQFHMPGDNHNKNWMCTLFSRKQKKNKKKKTKSPVDCWADLLIWPSRTPKLSVELGTGWASCSFDWVKKQNNSGCNVWVRKHASEKRLYLLNQCEQKFHSQDRYWEPGSGLSELGVTCYAWVNCCNIDLDYTTWTLLEHHNPWLAVEIGTV